MRFRPALLALVLLVVSAARASVEAQGSPGNNRAPRTTDELMQQFRAAHATHSVADIARLIYRSGVAEYVPGSTERQLVGDFPLTIARVTIQLLSADEIPRYSNDAKSYRPGIPVSRRMRVEFLPGSAASGGATTRSYLVGVKKGTFYIVSRELPRG